MNQNPFSVFDFFGYVFPGAFAFMIIHYFIIINGINFEEFGNFSTTLLIVLDSLVVFKDNIVINSSAFLILSYIFGHIIAYLSSVIIERFSVWWYGYPSYFLLNKSDELHLFDETILAWKKGMKKKAIRIIMVRFFVIIFILPLVLPSLVVHLFRLDRFFVKTLDPYLQETIRQKRTILARELGISSNHDEKTDFHRLIYHYEYENSTNHRVKMDNYIALYDFLRSLTLIFNFLCVYIFISAIVDGKYLSILSFIYIICGMSITFLIFMSFMKFYRRFTLEVLMCLVTDRTIVNDEDKKNNIYFPDFKYT